MLLLTFSWGFMSEGVALHVIFSPPTKATFPHNKKKTDKKLCKNKKTKIKLSKMGFSLQRQPDIEPQRDSFAK